MQDQTLHDWLTLSSLPGVGCTLIHRLVKEFGAPGHVLSAKSEKLNNVVGVGHKVISILSDKRQIKEARIAATRQLDNLSRQSVSIVSIDDADYPEILRNISDPPVLLYCIGNTIICGQPAVAIVGSRSATSYGKRISFELGRELARNGVCVVSGMALGIDSEAHAGALAEGGVTVGVLGCGVDVVYPRQNLSLFRKVEHDGLLVSEYPMGTAPDGFRFPERNRIISGLSLGVVVVEATLKSGSLITARLALEQGREVFAVPGRIDSSKSQGTHHLLQQGAKLVHGVQDILEELEIVRVMKNRTLEGTNILSVDKINDAEKRLLGCLEVYPLYIDELVRSSGYDSPEVSSLLINLELKGLVRQLPGQQYELVQQIQPG